MRQTDIQGEANRQTERWRDMQTQRDLFLVSRFTAKQHSPNHRYMFDSHRRPLLIGEDFTTFLKEVE